MTTDIIELSKQAAEVLGISAYTDHDVTMVMNEAGQTDGYRIWLAQDHARCAEIAIEKVMIVDPLSFIGRVIVKCFDANRQYHYVEVLLADHNNDRLKAYCVAVCKAVIEQAKGE